jgi:hypothetical protein
LAHVVAALVSLATRHPPEALAIVASLERLLNELANGKT